MKALNMVTIVWHPPPSNWLKVNIDGSALGVMGLAGSRGIFRTASGLPRGVFAFSIGHNFTFITELLVSIKAVEIAWDKGWHSLWLECNSIYVLHMFHTHSIRAQWEISQQWMNCLHLVSQMCFRISHQRGQFQWQMF